MSNLDIGNHSFDIIIRPGSLSNGTYTIYMNFTSKYNLKQFDVDSPLDVCTFSVTDTLSPRGNSRGALQSYIPEIIVK